MRKSRISVFASVATGASLALAGAAGGTTWSASFKILASTYEPFQVPRAAPAYPTGVSIPTNMRVVEILTSLGICKNDAERTSACISTTRSTSAWAMTKRPTNRAMPDLVHWWGNPVDQVRPPLHPTTVDVSSTSVSEGTTASSRAAPLTMPLVPLQASTGHDTGFHHHSEGNDHQRSKSWQKPPLPPNQFLARFYIVLQYLADVITADVVYAFLFGRWALRYYQRNRKNRAHRRRRRSLRRWSRFASRMCLALRNALPLNRAASSTVQEDREEIVTEGPSAVEVNMMPQARDCVDISSPARGTAIGLLEVSGISLGLSLPPAVPTLLSFPLQVGQPTAEASLPSKPSSTATGREEGTAVCPPSPGASGGSTGTAHNAGDATTQQASHRFIGWEKIGRDAYYGHSYEVQMANLDHIQDFHSFQRKARVFMAGFSSGLGIE